VDTKALSRSVAHALRHEPWLYELELDETGAVAVADLIAGLKRERPDWRDLVPADLDTMLATASKTRFAIEHGRIRAIYGHSLPQRLERIAAAPPAILFHGTSPEAAAAIRTDGLRPMGRQYVHLSTDRATAAEVGRRKADTPVILTVAAGEAAAAGHAFYAGHDKVWLADHVPPQFIA